MALTSSSTSSSSSSSSKRRRASSSGGASMCVSATVAAATFLLASGPQAARAFVVPRPAVAVSSLQQLQHQHFGASRITPPAVAAQQQRRQQQQRQRLWATKATKQEQEAEKEVEVPHPPAPFDPLAIDGALVEEAKGPALEEGKNNLVYKGMLLVVAILWGSNFGALKYLDTCGVDVAVLTAMRFLLASLSLLPALWGKGTGVLMAGLEVGLWVTLGYITQAIGLETTEASKSAFICSLTVVTVPFINALLFGKKIQPPTWAACALAVVGVGLLTLQGATGPVIGDLWSFGQPLGFGIAFMRIEHHMQKFKGLAVPLAAAQMLSVLFVSTAWAAVRTHGFQDVGDLSILWDPAHAASLLYTGIITSAFAVVLESIALAFVPAEETAVIFSTEPLFAAATSAVFLGERLKPTGMLGGLAILSACLVTQMDMAAFASFLPMMAKVTESTQQTD